MTKKKRYSDPFGLEIPSFDLEMPSFSEAEERPRVRTVYRERYYSRARPRSVYPRRRRIYPGRRQEALLSQRDKEAIFKAAKFGFRGTRTIASAGISRAKKFFAERKQNAAQKQVQNPEKNKKWLWEK